MFRSPQQLACLRVDVGRIGKARKPSESKRQSSLRCWTAQGSVEDIVRHLRAENERSCSKQSEDRTCYIVALKNNKVKAKDATMQQQQEILSAFTKKLEDDTAVLLDQVDMKYNEASAPLVKHQADVKAYLQAKTKSSLDFVKNIISNGNDEEILSLKHEVEEKAGSIEKKTQN
ncbi:Hypothetical predicted protein [Paramuricea clavata]|uniref:Uncharacterized protein n=1 Tax=Paramuricea clavata TaxID=317549 RepID=A0A7D9IRT1_PARCT|nr:Hypothetical predicted protein [Paramuricea clavata]